MDTFLKLISMIIDLFENIIAEYFWPFIISLVIAWYFHFVTRGWKWLKETNLEDILVDTTSVGTIIFAFYVSSVLRWSFVYIVVAVYVVIILAIIRLHLKKGKDFDLEIE